MINNSLTSILTKQPNRTVDGIPIFFESEETNETVAMVRTKWEEFYHGFDWEKELLAYERNNTPFIMQHLEAIPQDGWFMELGAGASFLGFALAKQGMQIILVDFDLDILRVAKKHFEKHGITAYFICADFQKLPIKDDVIDGSAGIGVIEHSDTIEKTVSEVLRVTKKGGYTFQTVPAFSLSTFILNQRYGTIPHIPILKQVMKLLHMTLLGARHMKYGYEESFTRGFLNRMFSRAGFSSIEMGFYDYNQALMKRAFGNTLRPLIKMRLFWDLIFIKAYKK